VNDPLRAQQMVRRQVRRRRRWRRLRVALLVVVSVAVVLAAAFGIDRLAVVVHKFYAEHHHSHPRSSAVTDRTTSTTTTTVPGPPRCDSPQLNAIVSDWRETGGEVEETVALTNISATACSLTGYATVGAVAQNGTPLPSPNSELTAFGTPTTLGTAAVGGTPGSTSAVGTTLPAPEVPLAHGARASFVVVFTNTCAQVLPPGQAATGAPNECYDGVWLDVTPPQGTSPLLVTQPVRLAYGTSGFQVGPFQAGSGLPLSGQPPLTAQTTSPTTTPPAP
jgi:Protein of unknown function (DUF4232)